MARVKRGVTARARHKKTLKAAKGYYNARRKVYRVAKQAVTKAEQYAYIGRKQRKRQFRALWIVRINAAARQFGLSYSRMIAGLATAGIAVDRKVLAELAVHDLPAFGAIAGQARVALGDEPAPVTAAQPRVAAAPATAGSKGDDLTTVEGVGPKIAGVLNEASIHSFAALAKTEVEKLREILHEAGSQFASHDPETWPKQAGLAAAGKFEELKQLQDELVGGRREDDLTTVEGVGPKIAGVLNEASIHSFAALAKTEVERLREILHEAGSQFASHDPETWPKQAGLAAAGKFEELKKLQDELVGGRKEDDLTMIEGVGPKIAEVLNEAGIHSFAALAQTEVEKLSEILHEAGSHFASHDPETWPKQAGLAAAGKFDELKQLQDELVGGRPA